MTFAAMVVFFTSLFFIVFLFTLKRVELRREARFAEGLRQRADRGALRVKAVLETTENIIEHIPFYAGALVRYGVHVGALSYARLAHESAEYAHRLADLVSHKGRFERRETKSRYLKEVSGYKRHGGDDINRQV